MKLILALVQPFKLDPVTRSLERIPRFPGMTVIEARGFGQDHADRSPRTRETTLEDFTGKVQVETVVADEQVDTVIQAIASAAHTGRGGDGVIFVLPVERAVRIASLREGEATV